MKIATMSTLILFPQFTYSVTNICNEYLISNKTHMCKGTIFEKCKGLLAKLKLLYHSYLFEDCQLNMKNTGA